MAILKLVEPVDVYPAPTILKIRLNSEISNQDLIDRKQKAMESGHHHGENIIWGNNYLMYTTSTIIEWKGRENEISRLCVKGDQCENWRLPCDFDWNAGENQCAASAGSKLIIISS